MFKYIEIKNVISISTFPFIILLAVPKKVLIFTILMIYSSNRAHNWPTHADFDIALINYNGFTSNFKPMFQYSILCAFYLLIRG